MIVKLYDRANEVGWLGWIEGEGGRCIGFIALDGAVQWGWR